MTLNTVLIKITGHLVGEVLPVTRSTQKYQKLMLAKPLLGIVWRGCGVSLDPETSGLWRDHQLPLPSQAFASQATFSWHSCAPHWALATGPGRSRAASAWRLLFALAPACPAASWPCPPAAFASLAHCSR